MKVFAILCIPAYVFLSIGTKHPFPQSHGLACDVYDDVKGKRPRSRADEQCGCIYTAFMLTSLHLCYSFLRLLRHDKPINKVKESFSAENSTSLLGRGVLLAVLAVSMHVGKHTRITVVYVLNRMLRNKSAWACFIVNISVMTEAKSCYTKT